MVLAGILRCRLFNGLGSYHVTIFLLNYLYVPGFFFSNSVCCYDITHGRSIEK